MTEHLKIYLLQTDSLEAEARASQRRQHFIEDRLVRAMLGFVPPPDSVFSPRFSDVLHSSVFFLIECGSSFEGKAKAVSIVDALREHLAPRGFVVDGWET